MSPSQHKQLYYNLIFSTYFVCRTSMHVVVPINHGSTKSKAKYSNWSTVLRRNSQEKKRRHSSSHEPTQHIVSEICLPSDGTNLRLDGTKRSCQAFVRIISSMPIRYIIVVHDVP